MICVNEISGYNFCVNDDIAGHLNPLNEVLALQSRGLRLKGFLCLKQYRVTVCMK